MIDIEKLVDLFYKITLIGAASVYLSNQYEGNAISITLTGIIFIFISVYWTYKFFKEDS